MMNVDQIIKIKDRLDHLYDQYNRPKYIDPDPLAFLYDYQNARDREVAGLIAACLAYGRVEMIMDAVGKVFNFLGEHPAEWLCRASRADIDDALKGFVYRFAREHHVAALLLGIRQVLRDFGSIEECFYDGMVSASRENIMIQGLSHLYDCLDPERQTGHLLADPLKKSACKRSFLFLRWMIRKDLVDPGGWDSSLACHLIVPLDTHMYETGKLLGFTSRRSQDMKTAMEITEGFREICPEDPVKYDFCLTRFGIRRDFERGLLEEELFPQTEV